jgi:hypothetical protein
VELSKTELVTMADETRKGRSRRAVFPADLVKSVDKLPPDERRLRLMQYIEEHGEDVEPVDGWTPYGPKATRAPEEPGGHE